MPPLLLCPCRHLPRYDRSPTAAITPHTLHGGPKLSPRVVAGCAVQEGGWWRFGRESEGWKLGGAKSTVLGSRWLRAGRCREQCPAHNRDAGDAVGGDGSAEQAWLEASRQCRASAMFHLSARRSVCHLIAAASYSSILLAECRARTRHALLREHGRCRPRAVRWRQSRSCGRAVARRPSALDQLCHLIACAGSNEMANIRLCTIKCATAAATSSAEHAARREDASSSRRAGSTRRDASVGPAVDQVCHLIALVSNGWRPLHKPACDSSCHVVG